MRSTDKVLREFRGGILELGIPGRLGGTDIGTQGLAEWGGWELAGLRERHSGQRHGVQSVTFPLPWKDPFQRA